jgi:beta-galactosidase/beta-glucuronidase
MHLRDAPLPKAQLEADAAEWIHEFRIASPQAWSPACPHLYRLVAEVWHERELSHCVETAFGLRTVEVAGGDDSAQW